MTTDAGIAKVMPQGVIATLPPLSLTDTIFSPMNGLASGGLLLLVPATIYALAPKGMNDSIPPPESILNAEPLPSTAGQASARWNASSIAAWLFIIPLVVGLGRYLWLSGLGRLGLNQITMGMLIVGLMLHGSLHAYTRAATAGASACVGIILQFPLYAGIMAMMSVSGLASQVAEGLVRLGSGEMVAVLSFIAAGLTNLLVPSGGGQWAIQGPIVIQAGLAEGVSAGKMVMSVAYGDQLTNMLQPFWALPLLSITKVRAADIVGYTALLMGVAGLWLVLALTVM